MTDIIHFKSTKQWKKLISLLKVKEKLIEDIRRSTMKGKLSDSFLANDGLSTSETREAKLKLLHNEEQIAQLKEEIIRLIHGNERYSNGDLV